MKEGELDAVLEYLVNRVKELKNEARKLKLELTDAFKMITELSEAAKKILEHQSRVEARLTKLEARKERQNMRKSETKKCPKCGAEMEKGKIETLDIDDKEGTVNITGGKKLKHFSIPIFAFYCKKCGYIEFYWKERKEGRNSHEKTV